MYFCKAVYILYIKNIFYNCPLTGKTQLKRKFIYFERHIRALPFPGGETGLDSLVRVRRAEQGRWEGGAVRARPGHSHVVSTCLEKGGDLFLDVISASFRNSSIMNSPHLFLVLTTIIFFLLHTTCCKNKKRRK